MTAGSGPRARRRGVVGTAVVLAVAVGAAFALSPVGGRASSHREAPLVSADPQVDNTDTYAFVSPDKPNTVTLISNWIPFEEAAGGPNFYAFADNVKYDFKIDNNGDAMEDITYRVTFDNHYRNPNTFLYNTGQVTSLTDPDLNFYQTYDLTRVTGAGSTLLVNDAIAVPSRVGNASMPDYPGLIQQGIRSFGGGTSKVFAGQAEDPFYLDLRVFDLLYGADFSEAGDDTLNGFNVNTIALQVPKSSLARNGNATKNPIIGMWSTATRPSVRVQDPDGTQSFSGADVQVSRLGNPLVNEVVIPVGDKDLWNASKPADDGQFLSYVQDPELPHLIEAIYGIPAPDSDPNTGGIQRADLIAVFLTGVSGLNQPAGVTPSEQLRLNMSIAPCTSGCSRLGVIGGDNAGYPNGRRPGDDVIDIALQVVEGELIGNPNDLGDGVDGNDGHILGSTFPFLATPATGSSSDPHMP